MKKIIVWFRQDLRLSDNPALCSAAKEGDVIPLYILDDKGPGKWKRGGASRWWLHKSLESLSKDLESAGSKLILRKGESHEVLNEIVKETGADGVYWNRCYEHYAIERDKNIKQSLKDDGFEVESYNGSLLFEPWEIKNGQGSFFKVYTPFWKNCLTKTPPRDIITKPELKNSEVAKYKSDNLDDWGLLPTNPDWSGGINESWNPGEAGAKENMSVFLDDSVSNYSSGRDMPGITGTSQLSPHLHYGEISPVQVWHASMFSIEERGGSKEEKNLNKFLSEIGWREFAYHLMYNVPDFPEEPFNKKFSDFPWDENDKMFKAWKKGQTGFPIVDAGMRQLWHTGWMHNRVRMIVASFLTKDLLIPWQDGADWFWDTLVDADLANNSAGWQWVAGCGADAAPYFRVFNPFLQGEKFDPEGDYVRKWVPELKNMPKKYIHKPHEADEDTLKDAGVVLDKDYPKPIIDHYKARDRALAAYSKIKGSG